MKDLYLCVFKIFTLFNKELLYSIAIDSDTHKKADYLYLKRRGFDPLREDIFVKLKRKLPVSEETT